jgi:hypothetical protein
VKLDQVAIAVEEFLEDAEVEDVDLHLVMVPEGWMGGVPPPP